MRAKITITKEHLERGIQRNSKECAVALSSIEALPLADGIMVGTHLIFFSLDQEEFHMVKLPEEVQQLITDFDRDVWMGEWTEKLPITFEIDVPDWALPKEPVRPVADPQLVPVS
jgi:hypothetical protein